MVQVELIKEFMLELAKVAFDPAAGLFRLTADGLLYPSSASALARDNHLAREPGTT